MPGAVVRAVERGAIGALLLGALALRLILWNRAVGFEQGDPIEYVNIAYRMAFGIGIEWWDLRPLLLSLVYVPVLYVAQWWPDPSGETMVRALRLVSVLFGVGVVWLTALLGVRLGGAVVGLGAGLLVTVNPIVSRLSVSTYAEIPSTFFIVLSLWLLVRALDAPAPRVWRLAPGAGLALGIGCMIRYQAIFYLPPIGLWVLGVALTRGEHGASGRMRGMLAPHRWPGALLLGFICGLTVALLGQAVIEQVAYGRPFHSLLASFDYNVTSGQAPVEFGQEPFGWFLQQAPSWLGISTLGLALAGMVGMAWGPSVAGWRLVGLAGATMFLALSALPHKEERFMAQVVPLLALFAAGGVWRIARLQGLRARRSTGPALPVSARQPGSHAAAPAVTAPAVTAPTPTGPAASAPAPTGPSGAATLPSTAPRPEAGSTAARTHASRTCLAAPVLATLIVGLVAAPLLWSSIRLDMTTNEAYVDGVKRAAAGKPGGVLGTIPWLVARPYAGTRLTLAWMNRGAWDDREQIGQTIEQSDFLLFPEYWLLEDPYVDRIVSRDFRSVVSYDNGVVLYENRRLSEPQRRRPRS
ncbi:MAG: glycosyltransferase family 39 protein [Chloroflexi bacterium]|nr:glycosyltransferase family 39 protein [Chloroflexota bacterium]